MKFYLFITSILIVLFKTGNVLSDNNTFNVNNITISGKNSNNKQKIVNMAFKESFDKLISRLLLENDYTKVSNTDLNQIKKLISYYQIINTETEPGLEKNLNFNVSFDKERMHDFFYKRNILYSDVLNTEAIIFPLLKKNDQFFLYNNNYFYENWNSDKNKDLIQFVLLSENIENIQNVNLNKNNIYKIDISNFFKEFTKENIVFAHIEVNNKKADIYLNTRIEGKNIKKNLSLKNKDKLRENEFYNKIIIRINKIVIDLIKSQNLIDVRTPSFLNVKIQSTKKINLIKFSQRIKKIELIDNFYVQQLNKDFVLVKIKYLGKIDKIIKKLKEQNMDLKMISGQWQLQII